MAPGSGDVTGLVLAGGRSTRMGGMDKGLVPFEGQWLASRALQRLRAQRGAWLAGCAVNANRHHTSYQALGVPVWPDPVQGQPGPLAGMLAGLLRCPTRWLLTVPCDAPYFPLDLLDRLVTALVQQAGELAVAAAPDAGHNERPSAGAAGKASQQTASTAAMLQIQPVFCLLPVTLAGDLQQALDSGAHAVGQWQNRHRVAVARFDQPDDDPCAFFNANSPSDLASARR